MIDPIGAFDRVRDFYISYLETAFRIRNESVSIERRGLLETSGSLCAEPIVEPLPRYEPADFILNDLLTSSNDDSRLPGFSSSERRAFVRLALSGLFEAKQVDKSTAIPRAMHAPYRHQAEMLSRGVVAGMPSVVTSGTGSGKTEAFLLPVLAMLAKEAATRWTRPLDGYLGRRWWQDNEGLPLEKYTDLPNRPSSRDPTASPFVPQREGETRAAAVRALVLYPMNALVEDQLARLRRGLDSEDARRCMSEEFKGNRIFLGKYTSATPVTGHHIDPRDDAEDFEKRARKLKELFDSMSQFQTTQAAARRHEDPNAHYLFPSVDGDEMVSRWDMQAHPPDILITNITMLNAMLAREVDSPIFAKTRDWLRDEPDSYFFLILDELHLQRGSAGTEVCLLLRLLIDRLGLHDPAHRHKLRILASSASLPLDGKRGEASVRYLWDFFGSSGTWENSRR